MMIPDRSDVSVTGTDDLNVSAKIAEVTTRNTAVNTNSINAHHPGPMRCFWPGLHAASPPSQKLRLAVDGQRDEDDLDRCDHHRGTHRAAHGLTDPGRPPDALYP